MIESPMTDEVFQLSVDLYRSARQSGVPFVVHRDRDFDALARVSPLEARRV